MSNKTQPDALEKSVSATRTTLWAQCAILGTVAGFGISLIPISIAMIFMLYIALYDCGYSTNCPSDFYASWHIIAGLVGSALAGGLIGGRLRYQSNQTDQAAFRGGRNGAIIGGVLFALAYIVALIWSR